VFLQSVPQNVKLLLWVLYSDLYIAGADKEREVGTLSHGKYFGELALLKEDTRQATVTAMSPGAECLVLDRGCVNYSLK
jgi:CRP-like cAMP-binding protein